MCSQPCTASEQQNTQYGLSSSSADTTLEAGVNPPSRSSRVTRASVLSPAFSSARFALILRWRSSSTDRSVKEKPRHGEGSGMTGTRAIMSASSWLRARSRRSARAALANPSSEDEGRVATLPSGDLCDLRSCPGGAFSPPHPGCRRGRSCSRPGTRWAQGEDVPIADRERDGTATRRGDDVEERRSRARLLARLAITPRIDGAV